MTLEEFRSTLAAADPPRDVIRELIALWHDGRGDWSRAHEVAQSVAGADGAWVHAYLHRKEGDEANARYWYRRAGRDPAGGGFDREWATIVSALLG